MAKQKINSNSDVTEFLVKLNHPLRREIELLRNYILLADTHLTENVKWNSPNYCFENNDRITIKIHPITTKQIQIIFHRGAKVKEQPKERLIKSNFAYLTWKANDRVIATFKSIQEIEERKNQLYKHYQ